MKIAESRIDMLIDKLNAAQAAAQSWIDAHAAVDTDPTSDALYEATYELCHHLAIALTDAG